MGSSGPSRKWSQAKSELPGGADLPSKGMERAGGLGFGTPGDSGPTGKQDYADRVSRNTKVLRQ